MSYQVDVRFPGMTTARERVPAMSFTVDLDTKCLSGSIPGFRRYVWRLLKPIPPNIRLILGEQPTGTWTKDSVGIALYAEADRGTVMMELRQVGIDTPNGPAFALPRSGNAGATIYALEGRWSASAQPLPKTWVGIVGKGSAGALIGAEGGIGALVALDWSRQGVCFSFGSGRVIAGGGFSGGLALVVATGFESGSKFDGYVCSGADWALSIGPNLKGISMSGKLHKLGPILRVLGAADTVQSKAEAYSKAISSGEYSKEIYGVVKGVLQTALIDTDTQTVTAIDVPLASAGAEAGFYYAWSQYNVLNRW
jgi:hypothetical protein